MLKADIGAITNRFSSALWADSLCRTGFGLGSLFVCLVSAFELAYRPSFWYPDDVEFVFLLVSLVTLNGLVHYRLLTNRPVTWRWMLVLSAMDLALITANIAIVGGLDRFIFVAYYPALVLFAMVFTSVWLGLAWTTMAAVAYSIVSLTVGSGLDRDAGDERVLVARLTAMYALVLGVYLITRSERIWRMTADTAASGFGGGSPSGELEHGRLRRNPCRPVIIVGLQTLESLSGPTTSRRRYCTPST